MSSQERESLHAFAARDLLERLRVAGHAPGLEAAFRALFLEAAGRLERNVAELVERQEADVLARRVIDGLRESLRLRAEELAALERLAREVAERIERLEGRSAP